MSIVPHLIDGRRDERGNRFGTVTDPATGRQTARVPLATSAVLDDAVAGAREAGADWASTSIVRRQQVMFRYRELLVANRDALARAVVAEHGKTFDDALGEVQRGIEVVEFVCGAGHLLKGESAAQVATDVDTSSARHPLGVCAGITPFNFPVMVPMWMFPVAIAAGNSFVLKPSEKVPTASLIAAELLYEAGLPPGVLQVVHGDAEAVNHLLAHPDVAAVSFVGSTPVARHVYAEGARNGKRVQALGGAKNHLVVLPDADLAAAADAAVSAAYGSAGERCMAISVLVAVGSCADELVGLVRDRAEAIQVGPGMRDGSEMGPLISRAHLERVRALIDSGEQAGAKVRVDGRILRVDDGEDGFFLGPTLLDDVTSEMEVYAEEIFGPVLCVVRCDDLDEALELLDRSPYGNGAAIFTRSGIAARRFQRECGIGMVGVNVPIPVPLAFFSFGGWRSSMFGGHDIYGPSGIDFYTRLQTVVSRWSGDVDAGHRSDLNFPTAE